MKPELILDVKATLGEGPCWDERTGKLYWVDIMGKRVHCFDPISGENNTIQLEEYVGCAVLTEAGSMVVGLQNGLYILDLGTYETKLIEDPEASKSENRFNDGKADPAGRLWAGTMSIKGKDKEGALYRCDGDGSVKKMLRNVSISNGLAWDTSRGLMYYIDTPTQNVFVFDYDQDNGEISNQRVAVTIPKNEGHPDGMTIDSEGMIWVSHWDGARITRWDPRVGEKLTEVHFPVARITSCCFGGDNLDELYVTTASIGLNEEQRQEQPHAGGLFRVKTGIKGTLSYRYNFDRK